MILCTSMAFSVPSEDYLYGFDCYWRIENFNCKPGNGFSIFSPEFNIKKIKSKWEIEIVDTGEFLGAFLYKISNPNFWKTFYSVSLLKGIDWVEVDNDKYTFKAGGKGHGTRELLNFKILEEEKLIYLPNGSLTIKFHIWTSKIISERAQCLVISRLENGNDLSHRPIQYFSNLKPSDLLSFPPSYNFSPVPFSPTDLKTKDVKTKETQTDTNVDFSDADELLKLFKEKQFSFVTIRTSNRDFLVHKAVLCAKSPVYNAMFEREMKETDLNLVEIDDIDSQAMTSFVKFIHFQPLDDLKWDSAVTLYYAADKYQINQLKKECAELLKKELSVENVCDALLLADLHQDRYLMSCTQEYFCQNSKFILTSKQWKDFLCHTELVAEVLHKLAEKM